MELGAATLFNFQQHINHAASRHQTLGALAHHLMPSYGDVAMKRKRHWSNGTQRQRETPVQSER
jgi:hypothetical protein